MNIEELHSKYINLFETFEKDNILYPVRGIETGDGWLVHIKEFLDSCEWIKIHNNYDSKTKTKFENTEIKIFQIKEKFGDCRCYAFMKNGTETQREQLECAIAKLEAKCLLTCETCGKLEYGLIKSVNGWVTCMCDECLNRKEK